ncbi:MAG: hypothetical protein A4E45_01685 [Methanosaeta sp. PtaB.Bin039]|nr:MAG: hypothetical protein A4E45_01685 [Methanosaeta sp. PtaB.Bin039]
MSLFAKEILDKQGSYVVLITGKEGIEWKLRWARRRYFACFQ